MGNSFAKPERQGNGAPPLPPSSPPPAPLQEQYSLISLPEAFTCELCIEPVLATNKRFSNKCSHPICNDCMTKHIQARLDDNIGKIPCPGLNCGQFLEPITCRPLVDPNLFVRWCDVLCESALMGLERSYCPNEYCSALIVNECGGNVKKAACPSCKRPFCFQCKLPWHAGFRCEESGELRDTNDRAFGVLAETKNWMRCPQCRHFVELIDGCRIVKCRCHASFCYKCGRQVHQHWCPCDHSSRCCILLFQVLTVFVVFSGFLFLCWVAQRYRYHHA